MIGITIHIADAFWAQLNPFGSAKGLAMFSLTISF